MEEGNHQGPRFEPLPDLSCVWDPLQNKLASVNIATGQLIAVCWDTDRQRCRRSIGYNRTVPMAPMAVSQSVAVSCLAEVHHFEVLKRYRTGAS